MVDHPLVIAFGKHTYSVHMYNTSFLLLLQRLLAEQEQQEQQEQKGEDNPSDLNKKKIVSLSPCFFEMSLTVVVYKIIITEFDGERTCVFGLLALSSLFCLSSRRVSLLSTCSPVNCFHHATYAYGNVTHSMLSIGS